MESTTLIPKLDNKNWKRYVENQQQHEILLKILDTVKPIVTHEVFLTLAAFAIGNKMIENKLITEYEGQIIGWGIIAIALAKAGVISDTSELISKIPGTISKVGAAL